MATEVSIGDGGKRLEPHRLRAAILGEVHARPFTPIETPQRILHFAFMTGAAGAIDDRSALTSFCERRGVAAPKPSDKQHRVSFGGATMRWEQHSEFTTYTWELQSNDPTPFQPSAASLATPMASVPQPGPLIVAIDLHLLPTDNPVAMAEKLFDGASLTMARSSNGKAVFATDFQPDPGGFVRILVTNDGLAPERAGALVQRVIEVETYRTLALLGLPEAQRLAPSIGRIERKLAEITDGMRRSTGLDDNHKLLDELTTLAAELEADAAASLFRFSASRAYNDIVHARLSTIGDREIEGYSTWSSFLARRMSPAMRTCTNIEERQANLSTKLARAANLLRTRVDVALEQQNRDLLTSMNERTRLQLRLQATVEGLSVAAITYYVVGLFSYVVKGVHDAGYVNIDPGYLTAGFVPLAALAIWLILRRIRRRHIAAEK